MALTELTQQSVSEAGIAASLAANVNIIPEPSVYFQDFTFGGTMFDSAFGNVENLGGVGLGVADKAVDEMIRLADEDRKKDDPALDTGIITELAAKQREATARFSDGHFYFRGMKLTTDEMNEALQMTRDNLPEIARREGWSDEQLAREQRRIDAAIAETDPQRKAVLIGEIEQDNPAVANDLENSAGMVVQARADNELTFDEAEQRQVNSIDDESEYQDAALNVLDSADTAEMAFQARSGAISVAGSTDLANSFEAGFNAAPEFNDQASDSPQVAQAAPVQSSPNLSGPVLA